MTHEEDTLRGMEQALEEAHQELDRFRSLVDLGAQAEVLRSGR